MRIFKEVRIAKEPKFQDRLFITDKSTGVPPTAYISILDSGGRFHNSIVISGFDSSNLLFHSTGVIFNSVVKGNKIVGVNVMDNPNNWNVNNLIDYINDSSTSVKMLGRTATLGDGGDGQDGLTWMGYVQPTGMERVVYDLIAFIHSLSGGDFGIFLTGANDKDKFLLGVTYRFKGEEILREVLDEIPSNESI